MNANADDIRTAPGKTDDGKPFDWFVQEKVRSGAWRLERLPAAVLGTPRDLEVYRTAPKGPSIEAFKVDTEAPDYCQQCWADLRIGHGSCGYRCARCFLILTHRGMADPSIPSRECNCRP